MNDSRGRQVFEELRELLDPRDVAEAEGLGRRGRDFDCPKCAGRGKARSDDGRGWYCVKCEERGDAVDVIKLRRGVGAGQALAVACDAARIPRAPKQPSSRKPSTGYSTTPRRSM